MMLLQVTPADQLGTISEQFFDYIKLMLMLGGILILAYVSVRFWLPRFFGGRVLPSGPIRVSARYPLEPHKNLYIVHIGDDAYLMGTSETDVYYFTALDAKAIEAQSGPGAAPPPGIDFSKLLRRTPKE